MIFSHFTVIYSLILLFSASGLVKCAPGPQIDAVVLDELLREIVDSSMSDLRHRLQEAVFATAFRRRIQQHTSATSVNPLAAQNTPGLLHSKEPTEFSDSKEISAIDKLLDDYIKPQKLSLALETYTTTTPRPVKLVTADDVTIIEGSGSSSGDSSRSSSEPSTGRMFDDAFKEPLSATSFPRVPAWVAVTVCTACVFTFFLLIGTLVYFISQRRSQRRRNFGLHQRRMMPDPLTVQGLCHTTSSCHLPPVSISSRRNSFIVDQDRAASSLWANP